MKIYKNILYCNTDLKKDSGIINSFCDKFLVSDNRTEVLKIIKLWLMAEDIPTTLTDTTTTLTDTTTTIVDTTVATTLAAEETTLPAAPELSPQEVKTFLGHILLPPGNVD